MTAKEGYATVANKRDLKDGGLLRVEVEGTPIVLAGVAGKIFAMDAVCSHEGGPLEEGTLQGYDLTCPWHYAVFDVRNAKVSDQTVWATNLNSYDVKLDEQSGDISVSLQKKQEQSLQQSKDPQKNAKSSAEAEEAMQRKYYAEEERKAGTKLSLELLAKEALSGTDIVTFKLARSCGGNEIDFQPGQFGFFKLQVSNDPKGQVRHFSIASSPTEKDFILISTRIRDSPYKQKLASLPIGSRIEAWGPQGDFVLQADKDAVFLSGGIGVTPFRSMVKYATDKQLATKIIMLDSNRNEQNILYEREFDDWAKENPNFKAVYTLTDQADDWKGEKGRIDKNMLARHLDESQIARSIFYICGPPAMLKAMQELLGNVNIPEDRIKVEEFTGY